MNQYSQLIPGLEDFLDEVPVPTKEEGGNDLPEPVDLDNQEIISDNVDITIDIEDNRDEGRQLKLQAEKERMQNSLAVLERITRNTARGYVGQEDFSSFIKNSITSIVNILGHVTNLFSTALFHGWRDFKRSELTEYSDSNRATMARLYSADFIAVSSLTVPTPQGMQGTYFQALSSLQAFLKELNMLDRSTKMLRMTETILQDIVKTNSTFTAHVKDAHRTTKPASLDKLFKDTCKFFTSKKDDKNTFKNLFSNIKEYETTVKMCIDMDVHLRTVAGVHNRLLEIEGVVTKIIDKAESLDRQQVDDLVKMVKLFADTFDQYATIINDLSRVNHNLTFVTMNMRSFLNM